jgi:hypothetical protein
MNGAPRTWPVAVAERRPGGRPEIRSLGVCFRHLPGGARAACAWSQRRWTATRTACSAPCCLRRRLGLDHPAAWPYLPARGDRRTTCPPRTTDRLLAVLRELSPGAARGPGGPVARVAEASRPPITVSITWPSRTSGDRRGRPRREPRSRRASWARSSLRVLVKLAQAASRVKCLTAASTPMRPGGSQPPAGVPCGVLRVTAQ